MKPSDPSRIWIYQSNRFLNEQEVSDITKLSKDFTSQWAAHGQPLTAGAEIRHNLFLILSVDEASVTATGCSIDSSVRLIIDIEQKHNISLFDRFAIAYRDDGELKVCSREEFEHLIEEGRVTASTPVFNNMVQTYADLESRWEVPFADSWHSRVFNLSKTV